MNHLPPSARFPAIICCVIASVFTTARAQLGGVHLQGAPQKGPMTIFVGTYSGPKSKGIYHLQLDPATGKLSDPVVAAETVNPSYLAIAPSHRFLYCIGEVDNFEGSHKGVVSAFSIDPTTNDLTLLNHQPSGGGGPCYIALDKDGRNAIVNNYGTGSVESLPIGPDGRLGDPVSVIQHVGTGPDKTRQEGPHAHSINFDPANRFALACDLGLDKIFVYRFDAAKGTLTPNDPPFVATAPGSGPRHLAFGTTGRFAYVAQEMARSVAAFAYDADKGVLTPIQSISAMPDDAPKGGSAADIHVHPNGKFLYSSDRGSDTIAIFSIDPQTGKLTAAGRQSTMGKTPRNFAIDPTGTYLIAANQGSNMLVVFSIDQTTGALAPTGNTATVQAPVCVKFVEGK
jgi:6-phosphogluconolactonase